MTRSGRGPSIKAEVQLPPRLGGQNSLSISVMLGPEVGQDSTSWPCVFHSGNLKRPEIDKGRYGVLGVIFRVSDFQVKTIFIQDKAAEASSTVVASICRNEQISLVTLEGNSWVRTVHHRKKTPLSPGLSHPGMLQAINQDLKETFLIDMKNKRTSISKFCFKMICVILFQNCWLHTVLTSHNKIVLAWQSS